jgi:hypothetical protein
VVEIQEFEVFVAQIEPRLRHALVATYGSDRGKEATAAALSWAWEHWERLNKVERKVAYLYRVGQSKTRRNKVPVVFSPVMYVEPWVEPGLGPALARLTERQRVAVVLVYGFSWTVREVAQLTGTKATTVQNHLERGLRSLRSSLEVTDHA